MTPGELALWIRARRREELERQKLREANIYSLAMLVRTAVWGKKMPSYDEVFGGERGGKEAAAKPKKQMTDREMYEQARLLNKLLGGTEE